MSIIGIHSAGNVFISFLSTTALRAPSTGLGLRLGTRLSVDSAQWPAGA